jgi:O-antigen biosynthesis protein WbqV
MTPRTGSAAVGAARRAQALLLQAGDEPALPGVRARAAAEQIDIAVSVDMGATGAVSRAQAALAGGGCDLLIWAQAPHHRAVARQLLEAAAEAGVRTLVFERRRQGDHLRPLALDDLLGASPVGFPDDVLAAAFAGRRIMVTGGGGSIGGALLRRLAALGARRLSLIDSSEYNLFAIAHDPDLAGVDLDAVFCDVRDGDDVARVFARVRPDIVFHAAAMKHVPIVETHPCQGVLTNILGTRNVAEAAARVGADLVFVSTDKAVHPKSVMGATKRLGSLYCRTLDAEGAGDGPRSIVVQLGNVLGSTGSVAPLFERCAAEGAPITVTHKDARRFFLTVAQAGDSLLQAALVGLAPGAPRGRAYVPEMGEEIAIVDLARDIVLLAGKRPGVDVPIRFGALRPGEKVRESLLGEKDVPQPTASAAVRSVTSPLPAHAIVAARAGQAIALAREGDAAGARSALRSVAAPVIALDASAEKRAAG